MVARENRTRKESFRYSTGSESTMINDKQYRQYGSK